MDGFDNVIRESWFNALSGTNLSNPWVRFKKKLQFHKSNLKEWNSKNRDAVATTRKNLQIFLESIDSSLMEEDGSATLKEQRVDHLTHIDLAQKAKIQWIIERDENSSFSP